MDAIQHFLFLNSGLEWEPVYNLRKFYRRYCSPGQELCAVSTNPFLRTNSMDKLYILKDRFNVPGPQQILNCLNSKNNYLVMDLPSVTIDLETFPPITATDQSLKNIPSIKKIIYTITFSGSVTVKKIKSHTNFSLFFGSNMRETAFSFLQTLPVNIDLRAREISVGTKIITDSGTTSLSLTPLPPDDFKFSSEASPKPTLHPIYFEDVIIEGEIGYQITGRSYDQHLPPPPPKTKPVVVEDNNSMANYSPNLTPRDTAALGTSGAILLVFLVIAAAPLGC